MMQCVASALPITARKGGPKGGDALAPLLALPHFDGEVIKKLRKQRVNALKGGQGTGGWGEGVCPVCAGCARPLCARWGAAGALSLAVSGRGAARRADGVLASPANSD
jgi:hypothetical protein